MVIFGLIVILQGIIIGLDAVTWHKASMPDYAAYGVYYAQIRRETYGIELFVSAVIILFGVLFLFAGIQKKGGFHPIKCLDCGYPARKGQRFCVNCGRKL